MRIGNLEELNSGHGTPIQTEVYAKFFHGLSNPTRFRIVQPLLDKEMNVSQLVDVLGASQSQVSNQLACLKWCGYVNSRHEGKYVLYRMSDERVRYILLMSKSTKKQIRWLCMG